MRAIANDIKCIECERQIKVGDIYEYFNEMNEMPMHKKCANSRRKHDPLIAHNGVCERCHMELPPTKECCEVYYG